MDGNTAEITARIAMLRAHDGNPRALRRALEKHGSLRGGLLLDQGAVDNAGETPAPTCNNIEMHALLSPPDRRFLALEDAYVLAHDDTLYPPLLAEVRDAPPLLFCRGDFAALSRPQVAIVGSRNASPAGLAIARRFAFDVARAGFVVTSGLALGIDAMAHEGALEAGGQTVAVLGCGVDEIYPRRHAALADRIRANGCVTGEFLPGTAPLATYFPMRNRIISALSVGVLVVEAAPDSGSLITARFAAEQGREVFAIPGSIHSPTARGCHQLIRDGATLVENSEQLVEALCLFARPMTTSAQSSASFAPKPCASQSAAPTDPDEACVLAALSPAGSRIDDLVLQTMLPAARISMALSTLAIRGRVHAIPGGLWQPA